MADEKVHQREMLMGDYQMKENRLKIKNKSAQLTYENQQFAAIQIQEEFFVKNVVMVTLIAEPGTGKTGTFLRTAYNMCTIPDDSKIINFEKVFIITGMSDKDWEDQTKKNVLDSFKEQVFHRGQFARLEKKLLEEDISNSLIIIDECHIGANKEHMLSKMLVSAGVLNIKILRERNIKILEVSATPGHTLNDSLKWGPENHTTVVLKPGANYIGLRKMRDQNRIFKPYNLGTLSELEKLCDKIQQRWSNDNPRWHAIRIGRKGKKIRENISTVARLRGWDVYNHDSKDRIENIDEKMQFAPPRHTFILVKDFWRAAKRMEYSYIGVVHESNKDVADTSVEAQSLAGRLCDYYPENYDVSLAPLIFTDIDAINDYIAWIESGGDYTAVERYRSRQITVRNGQIIADTAYTNPSNVGGLENIANQEQVDREERRLNRTRGVRVPFIINITEADILSIPSTHNKEAKVNIVLRILSRTNSALAQELRTFRCNEIMAPRKKDSTTYKNHITVAVRKKSNNEPCAVTIPEEERRQGKVWNCFIDKFENRLCFIIVGEV